MEDEEFKVNWINLRLVWATRLCLERDRQKTGSGTYTVHELHPCDLHGGRRELTSTSCPLTATRAPHVTPNTHTKERKCKKKKTLKKMQLSGWLPTPIL